MTKLFSLSLTYLLTLLFCNVSFSQMRQRVKVVNKTVVSDCGTLLRGAAQGLDTPPNAYPWKREELSSIKAAGLNTIHIYGEMYQLPTGSRMSQIDEAIQWAKEEGLYVILTIGNWDRPGWYSLNDVKGFWSLYAPRYKDETHVIFEIMNEPGDAGAADSLIEMEKEGYNIIKNAAPNSHIILMSYGSIFSGDKAILTDVRRLEKLVKIDWTNTSIGFHGYGPSAEEQEISINTVKSFGYPMICTEFTPINKSVFDTYDQPAAPLIKVYEKTGISYMHFNFAGFPESDKSIYGNPEWFKKPLADEGIVWKPDFGNWPLEKANCSVPVTEPVVASYPKINPLFFQAEWYNASSGVDKYFSTVGGCDHNDWVKFNNVFLKDFNRVRTRYAGPNGGKIEVRSNNPWEGPLLGTIDLSPTKDFGTFKEELATIAEMEGNVDIYFIFKGGFGIGNFDWFQFENTGALTFTNKGSVNNTIFLFPNPASNYIKLDFPHFDEGEVEIIIKDLSNRTCDERVLLHGDYELLDVSMLNSGLFFITASQGERKWIGRFIKN